MKYVVGVADMKMAAEPEDVIVTHALGSCIGVAAYDASVRVGGLLHVMMPVSSANPEKARSNPYMFVDTGLPALFEAMENRGASKRRLRVKIAGGALLSGNEHFAIGRKNHVMLKKTLWKAGVMIDAEDVGGTIARTMYLAIGSGKVWLSNAGKQWEL